jgi:hypothetical protein
MYSFYISNTRYHNSLHSILYSILHFIIHTRGRYIIKIFYYLLIFTLVYDTVQYSISTIDRARCFFRQLDERNGWRAKSGDMPVSCVRLSFLDNVDALSPASLSNHHVIIGRSRRQIVGVLTAILKRLRAIHESNRVNRRGFILFKNTQTHKTSHLKHRPGTLLFPAARRAKWVAGKIRRHARLLREALVSRQC